MPIILSAATATQPSAASLPTSIAVPLVMLILGLSLAWPVLAWKAGLFRRRAVCGPLRWEDEDSLVRFLSIGAMAVLALIVVVSAIGPLLSRWLGKPQAPLVANMLALPFVFGAIVAANLTMRRDGLRLLGLRGDQLLSGFVAGVVGLVLVAPWMFWVLQASEWIIRHYHIMVPMDHPIFEVWRRCQTGMVFRSLAFFTAVVAAPLAEEALFRGVGQTALTRLFTAGALKAEIASQPIALPSPSIAARWLGVLITAALFAYVHPIYSRPAIFILAVGLGYAYERTGNLWVPIFMHMLFNALQFSLFLATQPQPQFG